MQEVETAVEEEMAVMVLVEDMVLMVWTPQDTRQELMVVQVVLVAMVVMLPMAQMEEQVGSFK
jgi:hypothetical protein